MGSACCDEPFPPGDAVIIVSVQGNRVFVERKNQPNVILDPIRKAVDDE